MADLERVAEAVWRGNLRSGTGQMSSRSGVLKNVAYSYATRFEQSPGTNPEELLAAALASCYSMALANQLSKREHKVDQVQTTATCHLSPQEGGGHKITKIVLNVVGTVHGIDEPTYQQIAKEVSAGGCPVSAALGSIQIEVKASLVKGEGRST